MLHFSELLNYNLLAVLDADALGYSNYGIKVMHFFSEWNSCSNCPLDELWRINDEIWGLLFEEGYMLII